MRKIIARLPLGLVPLCAFMLCFFLTANGERTKASPNSKGKYVNPNDKMVSPTLTTLKDVSGRILTRSELVVAVGDTDDGGGGGHAGGGPGGKWYSMGSSPQTVWCYTYEQQIVWFPYPHYEVRILCVQKQVWCSVYLCYWDSVIWECTPGTQRNDYQAGGC